MDWALGIASIIREMPSGYEEACFGQRYRVLRTFCEHSFLTIDKFLLHVLSV